MKDHADGWILFESNDRDDQAKDEQALARSLEGFRKSWSPKDPYDARHFEQELYYLIATVQRVAQQPLVRQMSAALALVPPSPIFIETEKKQ